MSTMDRAGISNEDPTQIFEILTKLGEGSYGSVFKAIDKRDGKLVAIKVLQMENADNSDLMKEISILRECHSEYIVEYKGSYERDGNLWIAMEYCGGGSLCDLMNICERTLLEEHIAVVMRMSLIGLNYLHSAKKIHRDIKSGNILLTVEGECKLADFGVSAEIATTLSKRKTVIGTPYWMAPEGLDHRLHCIAHPTNSILVLGQYHCLVQPLRDDSFNRSHCHANLIRKNSPSYHSKTGVLHASEYNGKADIWSLAVTAIELAVGEPPHSNVHPMRAIFMIPNSDPPTLPNPEQWSPAFHEFLRICLQKNPENRPTADWLLENSEFVKKAKGKSLIAALVDECMPEIEEFRANETAEAAGNATGFSTSIGTVNVTGTMGTMNTMGGSATMVYNSGTVLDTSDSEADYSTMRAKAGWDSSDSGTMLRGGFSSGTMIHPNASKPSASSPPPSSNPAYSTATIVPSSPAKPVSIPQTNNQVITEIPDFYRTQRHLDAFKVSTSSSIADLRNALSALNKSEDNERASFERYYEDVRRQIKTLITIKQQQG